MCNETYSIHNFIAFFSSFKQFLCHVIKNFTALRRHYYTRMQKRRIKENELKTFFHINYGISFLLSSMPLSAEKNKKIKQKL